MFSLMNPSNLKPVQMPLIKDKEEMAIFCNSGYGPVFGTRNSNGYYDLLIGNSPNQANGCTSTLNNSYRCPEGQNNSTFLAGNYSFSVSEIEVFAFEK